MESNQQDALLRSKHDSYAKAYNQMLSTNKVEISNRPENHVIGRLIWKTLKIKSFSVMVMFLEVEGEDLGVVEFFGLFHR